MKRILYFYHENPLEKNAGNKTRVLNLLEYFKSRNYHVDFISIKNFGSSWEAEDIEQFKKSNLCKRLHILERKPIYKNAIKKFIHYKIPNFLFKLKRNEVSLYLTYPIRKAFEKILEKESFDLIIINYVYWAELIDNKPLLKGAKTIIDTHDFTSSRHLKDKKFSLSRFFESEIKQLGKFDQIWAISTDEQYLFSQFHPQKTKLVPFMINSHPPKKTNKKHDFIYVASDNPHNQEAAGWFFEKVYPLLPKSFDLLIIGNITKYIKDYPNVKKLLKVENLDEVYQVSKVAICPMLHGTGLKIKVVEALSYGLPVVSTLRGIDGLPNKINNGCLVSDDAEIFSQNMINMIEDKGCYQKYSSDGKNLYQNYFETKKVQKSLDKLLNTTLELGTYNK